MQKICLIFQAWGSKIFISIKRLPCNFFKSFKVHLEHAVFKIYDTRPHGAHVPISTVDLEIQLPSNNKLISSVTTKKKKQFSKEQQ